MRAKLSITFICLLLHGVAGAALTPPDHPLFDGDAVHEVHITFNQENWWHLLHVYFLEYEEPEYLAAEFDWADVHFDSIGVRFKGMSSFQANRTEKKSFKLDFDVFVQDQEIYGLDKLNLNCGFFDPSFVREKCAHEICEAAGLPSVRVNYAALYINDIYWGLYTVVEQVDREFIESRFGSGEDGNLWKGDPHGSLEYLGSSESAYYDFYGLKTNEQENDWFPLVELADGLNNTQADELPDVLSPLLDVNSVLVLLAVDNLLVNLDSYTGRCGNYYLYHRDLDGRFVLINWDFNESWGVFNQWGMTLDQLKQLDPYWVSSKPGQYRPLAEILWEVDVYREVYQGHLQRLMSDSAHPDTLLDRMEELRDLIRPYVYAEVPPRSIFNPLHFESAMSTDMYYPIGLPPGKFIPGLQGFIQERYEYLSTQIGVDIR